MARLAKLLLILHLCITFSTILWILAKPPISTYYRKQSEILLHQYVMGAQGERLNQELFAKLPREKQTLIEKRYLELKEEPGPTFLQKTLHSLRVLSLDTPPFVRAWIFFSLLLSILSLLRIEGADKCLFLLPLITVAYGFFNVKDGKTVDIPPGDALFPTEQVLLTQYLKEPQADTIRAQQAQLQRGFERFLIIEYAGEEPIPATQQVQAQKGAFYFHLARLETMMSAPPTAPVYPLQARQSPYLILCFLAWNLGLAIVVNKESACATAP